MHQTSNKPDEVSGLSQAELLSRWLSVAESQICALEVLSEQTPKVNNLLETDMKKLSEEFAKLTDSMKEQEKQVDKLSKAKAEEIPASIKQIKDKYKEMNEAIGQIIMAMQFQDRVSQNLVINIDVMKAVILYLQESIDITLDNFEHEYEETGKRRRLKLDPVFAQKVIEKLWLGELRNNFVKHLLKHGYIKNPEEVGHTVTESSEDSVDLF